MVQARDDARGSVAAGPSTGLRRRIEGAVRVIGKEWRWVLSHALMFGIGVEVALWLVKVGVIVYP